MLDFLRLFFFDYTFLTVVIGTSIFGAISGVLGSFAVLRKQSLLGDCIAHATLPGICIAFIFTLSKDTWVLFLGAIFAGGIGALFLQIITDYTHLKRDAALGIVLSVFFGFGLVLLTFIQAQGLPGQSGLHVFLFGNASTLLRSDVLLMGSLALGALLVVLLLWKEFKLLAFDPNFGATLGFFQSRLTFGLTLLTVIAIVIGLQSVGVVLMSALIIAPAVAARQWTDRLATMVLIAAFLGALGSIIGVTISASLSKMPTGPVIVLVISLFAFLSLLFSPQRGIVISHFRHKHQRLTITSDRLLMNMYHFSEVSTDPTFAHTPEALEALGEAGDISVLKHLQKKGLIYSPKAKHWGLTKAGVMHVHSLIQSKERGSHA